MSPIGCIWRSISRVCAEKNSKSVFELILASHFSFSSQLCGSYRMARNGRRVPSDIRMRVMCLAVHWTVLCLVMTAVIFQRSPAVTLAGEDWSITSEFSECFYFESSYFKGLKTFICFVLIQCLFIPEVFVVGIYRDFKIFVLVHVQISGLIKKYSLVLFRKKNIM